MNKTLTALVAAATLAGSLAGTATTASAQGRGFLPGLIVGGIVGGLMVHYLPAPTHLVYFVLAAIFVAQVAGILFIPELIAPRTGAMAPSTQRSTDDIAGSFGVGDFGAELAAGALFAYSWERRFP